MKSPSIAIRKTALLSLCCALILVGCSSKFASSLRKVTYPPDFKYTETTNLRTDMQKLALQMSLLDIALSQPITNTSNEIEVQREEVLSALTTIGRIATNLQAGGAGTNHPFMDDYMKDLVAKVDKARGAASVPQPVYYYAGKVSGGCVNCHKVNR
jgi:hypothetical protein